MDSKPEIYFPMLKTAEIVAQRYDVSRESQDEYALASQKRTAAGQEQGKFDDEIVPIKTMMDVTDKETGEVTEKEVTLARDEGNRPNTNLEGLSALPSVTEGSISAGNSSQLSDGAAAVVLMEAKEAERRGMQPMGLYKGLVAAGCEPDEMGIGPVFAVPKLLERNGLTIDDIDLWELNEAFAVQAVYCRDRLGIPMENYNVNGGSISIGHPYGMTGARQVGQILRVGKRRGGETVVGAGCGGGGVGVLWLGGWGLFVCVSVTRLREPRLPCIADVRVLLVASQRLVA